MHPSDWMGVMIAWPWCTRGANNTVTGEGQTNDSHPCLNYLCLGASQRGFDFGYGCTVRNANHNLQSSIARRSIAAHCESTVDSIRRTTKSDSIAPSTYDSEWIGCCHPKWKVGLRSLLKLFSYSRLFPSNGRHQVSGHTQFRKHE